MGLRRKRAGNANRHGCQAEPGIIEPGITIIYGLRLRAGPGETLQTAQWNANPTPECGQATASMAGHPLVVTLHSKVREQVMSDAGSNDRREDQICLWEKNHAVGSRTPQFP